MTTAYQLFNIFIYTACLVGIITSVNVSPKRAFTQRYSLSQVVLTLSLGGWFLWCFLVGAVKTVGDLLTFVDKF